RAIESGAEYPAFRRLHARYSTPLTHGRPLGCSRLRWEQAHDLATTRTQPDVARMTHGAPTMPHSRENQLLRRSREVVSLFPTRSRPQTAGVRVPGRVACPPNGGCATRPHSKRSDPAYATTRPSLRRRHAACAGIEVLVWVSALSRSTYTRVGSNCDASASSSPAYAQMITRSPGCARCAAAPLTEMIPLPSSARIASV